jgi:hypothetical protein
MTRPAAVPSTTQPLPDTLTCRLFRALYDDFDLHTLGFGYVAVPAGTPVFTGLRLSDIAWQLSQHEQHGPDQPAADAEPAVGRRQLPQRLVTEPRSATSLPAPADVERITGFLRQHPSWSAFWDKQLGLWRVTEDDPDSDLYAASAHADIMLAYMRSHS